MKLFPNPASNTVTVSATGLERIQLVDVSGRLIMSRSVVANDQTNVDVSALPSGIYFIEGIRTDGTKLIERLMKH